MASIRDIAPALERLLQPLVPKLVARGITAQQLIWTALAVSVAGGLIVALLPFSSLVLLLLPLALFARALLNTLERLLARQQDPDPKLRVMINELVDVSTDAALFLPLAYRPGYEPALVVLPVLLAVATELAGLAAVRVGGSRRYDGPMAKSDRAIVFAVWGIAIACGMPEGVWINLLLVGVIALLGLTIQNRISRAIAEATK